MGVFSRLSDIVNSNLSSMLDRAENPEKIVRLIIQEMEDTLIEVRSSAAKTLAEKKDLEKRIKHYEDIQADWARKAELAVEKDREDLAKGALLAKSRAVETVDALRQDLFDVEESLAKTDHDMKQLQAKLDEARAKQKTIDRRQNTAETRLRARHQTHDGRIDDALARYESVERKLNEMEGRVDAYDLGRNKPQAGASLDDEFAALEAENGVETELEQIKARIRAKRSAGPTG